MALPFDCLISDFTQPFTYPLTGSKTHKRTSWPKKPLSSKVMKYRQTAWGRLPTGYFTPLNCHLQLPKLPRGQEEMTSTTFLLERTQPIPLERTDPVLDRSCFNPHLFACDRARQAICDQQKYCELSPTTRIVLG